MFWGMAKESLREGIIQDDKGVVHQTALLIYTGVMYNT